jgi:LysR family hydrogen peroxide-inducible transcriptional activator
MKTTDIRRSLLNEELDAAIIANHPEDALLVSETLFYEQFFA